MTFGSHRDANLRRSAIKHFGGWRKAVESLGLGNELPRRWTKQSVINAILERRASGHRLFKTCAEDKSLFRGGIKHFGNWEKALHAAGINETNTAEGGVMIREVIIRKIIERDVAHSRDLTQTRVEQQLRRLCTTGCDLGAMVNRSRDRGLYDASLRYHGSWRAALTAAGVNLANVSRRRPDHFDREAMILWLRKPPQ